MWDEIVKQNIVVPTKLEDIGAWWFAGHALGVEYPLDTMNKSKEHGFLGFRSTKSSFSNGIIKYLKILTLFLSLNFLRSSPVEFVILGFSLCCMYLI